MRFIRHDLPYPCLAFTGERAPWWGGDLQTMRNTILGVQTAIDTGEEWLFEMPDGDRLISYYHAPFIASDKPKVIILIHGLAGDSDSSYVCQLANMARAAGFGALRICLRGASHGKDLARSSYHAGRADDIDEIVNQLMARMPDCALYLGAYSLGGTIAVNYITRYQPPASLKGVVSFCAPLDMTESAICFHSPRNRLYNRHFTKALVAHLKTRNLPDAPTEAQIRTIRSVRDYDDMITCHIAGYKDADAYYNGTTPLARLDDITVPTLLVHSDNDPLIPAAAYHKINTHKSLFCVITRGGGHVGFHEAGRRDCWQAQVAMQFFDWLIKQDDSVSS